jgi:hypothetical protein
VTAVSEPGETLNLVVIDLVDLVDADVCATRMPSGAVALTIVSRRGTRIVLRDEPDVLRALLDKARVAVAACETGL